MPLQFFQIDKFVSVDLLSFSTTNTSSAFLRDQLFSSKDTKANKSIKSANKVDGDGGLEGSPAEIAIIESPFPYID